MSVSEPVCLCVRAWDTSHCIQSTRTFSFVLVNFWSFNYRLCALQRRTTTTEKSYRPPKHSPRISHHSGCMCVRKASSIGCNRWNEKTPQRNPKNAFFISTTTVLPNELFVFFKERMTHIHFCVCVCVLGAAVAVCCVVYIIYLYLFVVNVVVIFGCGILVVCFIL